ncbi:MAG: hypothetical protein WAM91_15660 [Candidatus Acidiferrales bacterium]
MLVRSARAQSQQIGSIEFVARVSPTDGHAEPVRGFTFYLLRKSFQDIRHEAEALEPAPNMDEFIKGLTVSDELKTWMKKNKRVDLAGPEFPKAVSPEDVLRIPEFKAGYMLQNQGDRSVGMPNPRYREIDKEKNPQKYQKEVDDYFTALKKFIAANPDTLNTLEIALDKLNPGPRWSKLVADRTARVHRHSLELAEFQYKAGQCDTDLDGHGRFDGLPAGDYWISTIEAQAMSGDARVRWDLRVQVVPGRASTLQLSNLNGIEPRTP